MRQADSLILRCKRRRLSGERRGGRVVQGWSRVSQRMSRLAQPCRARRPVGGRQRSRGGAGSLEGLAPQRRSAAALAKHTNTTDAADPSCAPAAAAPPASAPHSNKAEQAGGKGLAG